MVAAHAPVVRRARYAEVATVAALVTDAAHDLPLAEWLVPGPQQRPTVLTEAVRIWVEHALFFGEVDVLANADGLIGAGVWFHRYRQIPPPAAYEARLAAACHQHTERFTTLGRLLDGQRPETGHEHLALLAIAPDHRATGIAARLLDHHHSRLDRYGTAAYTEAFSDVHRDLLARHGYQARPPLHLTRHHTIHPMWRPGRTPQTDN
ncbi:N-acetyltransferase [Micromonospora polyrhachis]|uniref:GNAT superfamily N-acetyltransferase n=1 Tax=Micromonospora polyrhachis TaxID=1282883 RepID=A0A7W7SS56_9ACTN|nr:N-acetyltransferase [Micromonospora polyrhachis]MBB4959322.1 GNAT superfamily N-acetyltransferase [Micromonospora polyrhachis]